MTRNCTLCKRPIVLMPSAAQRAAKDVTRPSASYYTGMFTEHAACTLEKRRLDTLALMTRLRTYVTP